MKAAKRTTVARALSKCSLLVVPFVLAVVPRASGDQSGGGSALTLDRLILKIYSGDGLTLKFTDSLCGIPVTCTTGGGQTLQAGETPLRFTLDASGIARANLAGFLSTDRVTLEAKVDQGSDHGDVNNFYGASITPEPATLGMVGLALAGLGAARFRKRKL